MELGSLAVLDQAGEYLGSVADLILDIRSGRVLAVSVSRIDDGASGDARNAMTISWESVRFDHEHACLRLVEQTPRPWVLAECMLH